MFQIDFVIQNEQDAGKRLDKFLATKLEQFSRSQIKKHLDQKNITVNQMFVKSGYQLSLGDSIYVRFQEQTLPEYIKPIKLDLDIIYEDKYLIVLNKTSGITVHPGIGKEKETLVHALFYHCKGALSDNSSIYRPGVVHRLDKDTTGLIVFAKNNQVHTQLQEQFKTRTAFRVYQAFTWHSYSEPMGIIETYLGRSKSNPKKQAVVSEKQGKKAITKYKVIEEYPFINFVRFKLETGRTHQIRVHSTFSGHPIFGDTSYSGKETQLKSIHVHHQKFAKNLLTHTKGQALHASQLHFIHPTKKKRLSLQAEMPPEMKAIQKKLQGKFPNFNVINK